MKWLDRSAAVWARIADVGVENARQAILVMLCLSAVILLSTCAQTVVEDAHYDVAAQRAWEQRALMDCHILAIGKGEAATAACVQKGGH